MSTAGAPRRILVAGAGAIGQWLGARLQAAGHDVTLLLRARFADVIAAQGLTITGQTEWSGPIATVTEPAGGPYDAVFLTCKAYDTAPLAAEVAPLLASDGILVSMQNGLGNGQKIARIAPGRAVVALTSNGAMIDKPGTVIHAGVGTTTVGPADDESDGAADLAHRLLHDAGLVPEATDDIRAAVWTKAIVNAAINPIGAVYGIPNGDILADPELLGLSRRLAKEATALAERARVTGLPDDLPGVVESVLERTATNRCSMLQDMDAGRATEIEQITGRMVRLAELLLCSVPTNESIYGRVKDMERDRIGAAASERLAWDELQYAALPI